MQTEFRGIELRLGSAIRALMFAAQLWRTGVWRRTMADDIANYSFDRDHLHSMLAAHECRKAVQHRASQRVRILLKDWFRGVVRASAPAPREEEPGGDGPEILP